VVAILVVRDGAEWLPTVLATIAAQRYPALDLVVVDNASTDGSSDILARRIPDDRLITLPRNVGYTRAVATALQHPAVAAAPLVLLLHDDLVLAPDAIARLVHAMREDPALGIVGPKLRDWSDEPILQEVGMTIDRFGRAESPLEAGELDQGQHDRERATLYVSTAGMLVRTDVLAELGGFDVRFPVFRDDLDLCWRAWLAGHRVRVVPGAVAYHIAAASRKARDLGRQAAQDRYLAERHTLATLVKNYSLPRLLWVLPLVILLAAGKVGAFLVTRRFADAAAVVRAYAWNTAQLPRTLRLRKAVQKGRRVSDRSIGRLFAPGLPRARVYVEGVGSWLAGGNTRALLDDPEHQRVAEEPGGALVRTLRRYPAASAGLTLLVLYLVGLRDLLGGGQVVGMEIAPWPETARAFLRAYASPWNGEPIGSAAMASPVQAVLGLLSVVGFGSAWLAQRLLVFGLLPVAWVLTLRAGRLVTAHPGPRVLGATLYALSPVVMGALGEGRYGTLVAATLLPGIVLVAMQAADPRTPVKTAWRSSALLALGLALTGAAEPGLAPALVVGYLAILAVALRSGVGRPSAIRLGTAGGAALLLLSPWLFDIVRGGTSGAYTPAPLTELALWRALAAAPDVLPSLAGLAGVRSVVTAAAVAVAGVLLGLRTRPGGVAGLVAIVGGSALAAWGATRAGVTMVWTPALLLPAALGLAGLGVIAARTMGAELRAHAFGARQVAVVVSLVALTVGLSGAVLRLASGPWDGLQRNPRLVPEFVTADEPQVGPYRVLLLAVEDGAVTWDLIAASGPSMVNFGTRAGTPLVELVDGAVGAAVGGADLRAGAQLGLANVRYVVVSDAPQTDTLINALGRQPALEPLPSGGGRVFAVTSWLPRAVVLPPDLGELLLATGDPGATGAVEEQGLMRLRRDVYATREPIVEGGLLVVSEAESALWRARADGRALQRGDLEAVNAFTVPPDVGSLQVQAGGRVGHRALVALQILLLLAVISLALRPPGFAQARAERGVARGLPAELGASRSPSAPVREDPQEVRP